MNRRTLKARLLLLVFVVVDLAAVNYIARQLIAN